MNIATIYTLYNRRAGAELCFEKVIESIYEYDKSITWIVFCNQQAKDVLNENSSFVKAIYIPYLDNQYKKAFWLEYLSQKYITPDIDCFWIPSGCNHFPGHWNIPIVTTFHDLGEYHIKNKYSIVRTVFRKKICIPRSIKRSNAFTAVSAFTAKDMERFLSIPIQQIKVIYNGSSPHSPIILDETYSIIKKWGLQQQQYLFTPGRTDYIGKGLDVLLEAFRKIQSCHPNIKLVLVGPEGEGHSLFLKKIAEDNYADSHILYLGRVNDKELISLYSNCLATVISSRFEGFGFPILEAMTYNVPIICSDAGSLQEIAEDAAITFESGNSNDLSNSIKKLLGYNSSQIEELKNKGQKRLQTFTWKKCAQQMLDTFQTICKMNS
ncbi:glycosyltransferase family 4 protein [Bacteroides sp. K03]|uniref:glycosyltransferase family 4 protein n=1 Tax=Bacteroides sp. K03 TaxID=2718928 RepID=UPI001C8B7A77|nr:glycosyltransferase family 1 protein [Bacteroides sp. K03]MBX9189794.1 glycosyltransferase family 4 protein [Bacteroides sp. K03]